MSDHVVFLRFAPWSRLRHHHPHDLMWPVSMLYASSLARREGWQPEIIDLHVETASVDDVARRILASRPRAIFLDTTTPTVPLARQCADALRQGLPDLHLYAVGQHATARSVDLLDETSPLTACVQGEYEEIVAPLLHAIRTGASPDALPGLARWDTARRQVVESGEPLLVEALDRLPVLDPKGLPLARYGMRSMHVPQHRPRWGFLMTSRGCPYHCLFCSPTLRVSHGQQFRAQSADRVVEDLARLQRDHDLTAFYLLDDLFSYDQERAARICEEILRRRLTIHWAIQTRVDGLSPPLLSLLKRAGCAAVKVGIESGSDRILALLQKSTTRAQLRRGVEDAHRAGLSVTACFMLGNPTETLDEMRQTFQFARELRADMVQVAFHTPYPGSESFERFRQVLEHESPRSHYEPLGTSLSELSAKELRREQRRFYLRYYTHLPVLLRYLRTRAKYRLFSADEWALLVNAIRYAYRPTEPADLKTGSIPCLSDASATPFSHGVTMGTGEAPPAPDSMQGAQRRVPQLLAPAGSLRSAIAAMEEGADAVYVGLSHLSHQRDQCRNFTEADLLVLRDLARERSTEVYVTFNSSYSAEDMREVLLSIEHLADLPVRGVILSDIGIIREVRPRFPDLIIKYSVQGQCANSASARILAELGVDRIVLDRNVTIAEAREIRERSGLGVDLFAFGFQCYSQDSICYFGDYWSGLPCKVHCTGRVAFSDDRSQRSPRRDLFMKYYSALRYLPDLLEAGIDGLKLEGRHRSSDYTRRVTRVFRAALDHARASAEFGLPFHMDPSWERELHRAALGFEITDGFFVDGDYHRQIAHAPSLESRTRFLADWLRVLMEGGRWGTFLREISGALHRDLSLPTAQHHRRDRRLDGF